MDKAEQRRLAHATKTAVGHVGSRSEVAALSVTCGPLVGGRRNVALYRAVDPNGDGYGLYTAYCGSKGR